MAAGLGEHDLGLTEGQNDLGPDEGFKGGAGTGGERDHEELLVLRVRRQ